MARGWAVLNGSIRDGMDPRRYEIATIGAARALRSTYCTAAHAKFLRDDCGDERAMVAIATGEDGDGLDEVDQAVLAFAGKVARDAASISEADVDALRQVGLTDNEIGDVVFAAAARCFFANVVEAFGARGRPPAGRAVRPRGPRRLRRRPSDRRGLSVAASDDPYYRAALAKVHHEGFGFHADACAPGILGHLAPIRERDGLVLEIGCGSGLLTKHLTDAGHRVIATDASPAMLDIARAYAPGAARAPRRRAPR